MRLPPVKKILREDIKDAPTWVNAIIEPFNSFAESVYQTLNRNVTLDENVRCFIKEITYKTTSMYPAADPVEFQNELKVRATGILVLQAIDKSNYTPAPGPVYVPWIEDNGTIVLGAITGLAASKTYTIRLLIT